MNSLINRFEQSTGKIIKTLSCFMVTFFILTSGAISASAQYEKPGLLQAKNILKPELLKNKNYSVQDKVKNDGLFNHYTVESRFGVFEAGTDNSLKILLNEIDAIADMKLVETDDTAIAALKQSGQNTVSGVKNLFNDPQNTLEGAASGVASLFNRGKETIGKREATDAEDSKFEQFIGISKSKGIIATKYGVNVYSRNEVLQEELDRLGQADYLGGLGVGIASSFVPGVGGLILSTSGTARLLNEAINTTPASELWLQNKNKLVAMKVNSDTVELFLNNPSFSPALSTVLVAALESMKGVDNRGFFIKIALQASDPAMAKIITKIVVMSAGYNKEIAPLKNFVPFARIAQGVRKDGTKVVFMPADHVIWSKQVAAAAAPAGNDEKVSNTELWILGSLSKQATAELKKLGWDIHVEAESQLFPARK